MEKPVGGGGPIRTAVFGNSPLYVEPALSGLDYLSLSDHPEENGSKTCVRLPSIHDMIDPVCNPEVI